MEIETVKNVEHREIWGVKSSVLRPAFFAIWFWRQYHDEIRGLYFREIFVGDAITPPVIPQA